jgi:iron complex outermembrane receptor protein
MNKLILLLLLASPNLVEAQSEKFILSGRVTDQNNLALPFASVFLEGTEFGTLSNEKGLFLFKAPAGEYRLICKLIGYVDYASTINIGSINPEPIEIRLTDNINELNAVVISAVKVKSAAATRTLTEIQDIPQAIVVLGQKTIKEQAAFDLTTITRNMSGINFTGNYSGAGSYQFFNARGFDMVNSQNFRWNGMMIWNLGNNYADNIEQVEFLKGPSSILFGDVAPGGVLNFTTKKPLSHFYLRTEMRVGEWNLLRPAIDISGSVTKNKNLRYRLNTSFEKSNSFREYVRSERFMIAPVLTWDITKQLSVTAEAVFRRSSATDDSGLISPDGTVQGLSGLNPRLYLSEPDMKYLFSDQGYFLNTTFQVHQNWRLRAQGFYGYTENRPLGIWPDAPDENGFMQRNQYGYKQWLRNGSVVADMLGIFFTGNVKHNVLFGTEYQLTRFRYTNEGYLSAFDTNNIYNPLYYLTPVIEPDESTYLPFISKIRRYGIFFQDQLMFFNEKLHLMLGFRYGNTLQGNDYLENELSGSDYEGYTDDFVDRNVFTPRIGLVFKPVQSLSIYASYAEGYEINSPDIFALNYAEFSTPPATISSQVEFGAKSNLLKNKLGLTICFFQIDKTNPYGFYYLDPDNPNFDEYNVYYDGHHRSRGSEIDVGGKILPSLSLTFGAAYTSTAVIEDPGYPSGNRLPNAPLYAGNMWVNFEPEKKLKGFTTGFGFFYKDKFFSGIDNNPALEIPASFTIDVAMGYMYKSWGVQLNISNVTNQVNYSNPWIFNLFEVRPLRRAVITLNYTFDNKNRKLKSS